MDTIKPSSEKELREAVMGAVEAKQTLEITAGAGRPVLGRPVEAARRLQLSRISGIVSYQPEELVLTVKASTPLAEIETALAQRGQLLAFEPPRFDTLLGTAGSAATLGGTVAAGLSGPRRLRAGAARDH